jgi:hypothetical protein
VSKIGGGETRGGDKRGKAAETGGYNGKEEVCEGIRGKERVVNNRDSPASLNLLLLVGGLGERVFGLGFASLKKSNSEERPPSRWSSQSTHH